ncbi:VOC family protein [Nocardioides dongxiaopingii]|uniref:VOC family protein n=1 Tax=Nocardioides sp. S-1144 TaxID=2582905 RepID=UPI00110E81FB|nr:VOC family protein [Nocardioides sp. S-1144]QCW50043.1 VOC family protein [Nocardioides sp. S-1144]
MTTDATSAATPTGAGPTWLTAFLDLAPDDFERGVVFWAGVTGCEVSPSRGRHDEFATLVPADGDAHLRLQCLRAGRSDVHLDLHVADPWAAAERAVRLGASVVADRGYVVLESLAGLTFCLVPEPGSARPVPATPGSWPGGRSQVDQVCLDVGPAAHDAECAFWQELTGFDPTPASGAEFRRLDAPGMPLRLLLQRLDEERPPGIHLDLAADDRAAEVERHLALGATPGPTPSGPDRGFTVLVDPAGSRYCITDRVPGTRGAGSGT